MPQAADGEGTTEERLSRRIAGTRRLLSDASKFEADLEIRGEERFGYKVLTVSSAAVPNGIAARSCAGPNPTGPAARTWAEDRPDPATANYKRVIFRAAPRSPRWPGRVLRAW